MNPRCLVKGCPYPCKLKTWGRKGNRYYEFCGRHIQTEQK